MVRYAGKDALMYLQEPTGVVNVAYISDWSLDASRATYDVTALGDSNITQVVGLPNYIGTFTGFWSDDSNTVYDASEASAAFTMALYPSKNAMAKGWIGPVWMDYTVKANVKGSVDLTGKFVAAGSWRRFG